MRYIIVAISILIAVSLGCYTWYKWDVRSFEDRIVGTHVLQIEESEPIKPQIYQSDSVSVSNQNKEPDKRSSHSIENTDDHITNSQKKELEQQSENGNVITGHGHTHDHESEHESPFGFGAYPEIPEGFPVTASWQFPSDMFPAEIQRQGELVTRVLIGLYNEGDHDFIAGKWHKGKVYPLYSNTFYVEINEGEMDIGGKVLKTETVRILGPGGTSGTQKRLRAALAAGETLPGVRMLDMQSHGVDPYDYLFTDKGK